ncbi:HD domain-containing protein [uncultured Secundilactobacillus sp.]|uniref:Ppx/GppA phosphatase family protein n=1 Tax=uncultured Secundilactobacillus sp. TaxID=2813935 RepID=UPI00258B2D34|nr:HD domain-containing protein [uncultured Secundilactobacillus sp.]
MKNRYFGTMIATVQGLELLISDLKSLKPVERVRKELPVGDDIYQHRPLPFSLVTQLTTGLQGFLQLLNDYQVTNYQLWGSEALSQALNADFIADQIDLRTGLRIHWLSINEESYFRNQAVLTQLKASKIQNSQTVTQLVGINSGNTTVTQFRGVTFNYSTNFAIGPVKIAEDLQSLRQNSPNSVEVLTDYIDSKLNNVERSVITEESAPTSRIILLGSMPLSQLARSKQTRHLSSTAFESLFDTVVDGSDQFLIERLGVKESDLQLLLPELLMLRRLIKLTNAKELVISDTTVLDGLAINEAIKAGYSNLHFTEQTIITAQNMADHYGVEPVHRQLVTKFALHLFDQLKPLHQLDARSRVLLEVASLLHDVGGYVGAHEHYLHSDYLIQNSDIIGLSNHERNVIAAIARYHSTQTPGTDLSHFQKMTTQNRLQVAKLAAILRLADALDDDHQQKIQKISVSLQEKRVVISAYSNANLSFENWVFAFKSHFFEETFGLKAKLKQRSVTAK